MAEHVRDFQEKNVILPNGLTIHYYEWPGPRPNLVLLHPSSGYGRMWEATANALGTRATWCRRSTAISPVCDSPANSSPTTASISTAPARP